MYIYMCIYICMYIYVHTYVHIYQNLHVYIRIQIIRFLILATNYSIPEDAPNSALIVRRGVSICLGAAGFIGFSGT